jgi:hypothetical protein
VADTKAPPETTVSSEGAPEGRSGGSALRRVGIILMVVVAGFALVAHKLGGGAMVIVLIIAVVLFLLFLLLRHLPSLRKHFGSTGRRVKTRRTRTTRTRRSGPGGAGARRGMPGKGLLSSRRGGGRAGAGGKGLAGSKRKGALSSGGRAGRAGGTKAGSLLARRGGAKGGAKGITKGARGGAKGIAGGPARKGLARRSKTGAAKTGAGAGAKGGARRGILGRKGGAKAGGRATGSGTGRRGILGRKSRSATGTGSKGKSPLRTGSRRSLRHPFKGGRTGTKPNTTRTGRKGTATGGGRKGASGTGGSRHKFMPWRGKNRTSPKTAGTGGSGSKATPKKRWSPKSKLGKAAWWSLGLPLAGGLAGGSWAWRKGQQKRAARKAAQAKHTPPPRGHKAQPGGAGATGKTNHRWVRAAGARYRRARSTYRRWAPWSRTTPASHAAPKVKLNRPRWHRRAWSRVRSWRPGRRNRQQAPFRYYVRQPTRPVGSGTPAGTSPGTGSTQNTGPRMPDPASGPRSSDPPPAGHGSSYHPGGTNHMSTPVAQATEAVQESFGSYDPEHMQPVGTWLEDLPEFFREQANAFNAMITRLREEYPMDPGVADHYESLVGQLSQMGEHAEEGVGIYRAAHAKEIERLEEPRANEAAWDVSNTPDA